MTREAQSGFNVEAYLDNSAAQGINLLRPEYLPALKRFCRSLRETGQPFFLANELQRHLDAFGEQDVAGDPASQHALRRLFHGSPEAIISNGYTYATLRPKIGLRHFVRMHAERDEIESVSRVHYLQVKDSFVQGPEVAARPGLQVNFAPYFQNYPKVNEPIEMGQGISFLNRQLSGQMYQHPESFRGALLRFLIGCNTNHINILANDHLRNLDTFAQELDATRAFLADCPPDTPYEEIAHELRVHGFEPGWGDTAGRIAENLGDLARVWASPDAARMERMLGRLPFLANILMVSPHGWFAQEGVLGRPDTGGQVTYVLDQARALEKRLKQRFADSGIPGSPKIVVLTRLIPEADGTACNQVREKVHGSDDCWIVRVPFHDSYGNVLPDWISRFHIWPYLRDFADHAKQAIVSEFFGKPDLIIGHYSDGNLVAHLMAKDLDTTHCAAVHALEKTKYLFSDLHWAGMEAQYHWSLHFTADLIAYNSADFIITSSFREIGGTSDEMGMFESYETFSMPGLYRVVSGLNPLLARYNIVPPGASEEYFFPYPETERRYDGIRQRLDDLLFNAPPDAQIRGELKNPALPPIFAMSRVDKVKNLGGLVEIYGRSPSLRKAANLIILSSILDPAESKDAEEIEQLHLIQHKIEEFQLHGHVRWIAARLDKIETGEIYRVIADHRGVFAQPALMETFGLTVIEAMACGLPVVVTCFGGPAEIVEPGKSGEVEDPNDFERFADALERTVADAQTWEARSTGGMARVAAAFNWPVHADRLLQLANVYAYWKFLDVMNRGALDQYIHTLYHAVYRPRVLDMTGDA